MSKQMDKINLMSTKEGHSQEYFDPEDPKDVRRIMRLIKDKIKHGYYFYAAKKNGEYYVVKDPKLVKEDQLERFLLTKPATKKLITPPVAGG